jgi:branched-chain amino acid transport system permease protein
MARPPRPDPRRIAGFLAALVIFILACLIVPAMKEFQLVRIQSIVPFAIGVLSINLLTGISGQISLGQSAFFGVGAYVSGILINHGWSYLTAGIVGVVGAGVLGLLVGLPAVRLRGLYIAITTLGIGLAFPDIVQKLQTTTGGSQGLAVIKPLEAPGWTGANTTNWTLYVSLFLLMVAMLIVWNIRRSPTGRALLAMRDHEQVAESFGIRLARMKLFVFVLSAALAGLAGVVFLIQQEFLAPTSFGLTQSIDFFVGMAIGGQLSIFGAVFGGIFLVYAPVESTNLGVSSTLTPVVYAAFLLIFVYFVRNGVAGAATSLWDRLVKQVGRGPASGHQEPPAPKGTAPDATREPHAVT